ncbi:MAG TPA: glycosyltransferase family 2 protein, partial [Candidatus Bathyarchaeia archaeon]
MNKAPLVFVIVVNYNGLKYLETCFSSLEQQTYKNYRIIMLDNASTDNSVQFTQKNFSKIFIIQANENYGFAKGNNLAIGFALDQKADYVFLVNNDTEVERDLLKKLVGAAEGDSSIGVVGPAIFGLKNKGTLQELGMAVDRFGYPLAIKTFSKKNNCVFFVSGCAMLIKSDLLRKIGLFDEKYFMFAEDLDLCWRGRLSGYKIIVVDNAKIYHASGGSISGGVLKGSTYKTNVNRIFLREKNTIRTLIKNYETSSIIKIMPSYMALLLFEAIFWSFIFKPNITKNILKAISWNIKHLPDTLQQRVIIQNLRKISDKEIAAIMVT